MSSSEDYLDSLLDSILGGGKPDDEKPALDETEADAAENKAAADGGKAMSPDEIEEMLVSMGTLDSEEDQTQESDVDDDVDDMEAMLAFMNEHNASVSEGSQIESLSLDDTNAGEDELSSAPVDDFALEESGIDDNMSNDLPDLNLDELSLDGLDMGEKGLLEEEQEAFPLENLSTEGIDAEEDVEDELSGLNLDDLSLDNLDDLSLDNLDDLSLDNLDDFSLDDLDSQKDSPPEEIGMNESVQEDMSDFNLDDLSLDDLSLEETEENMSEDGDGMMSEEEIDRLLGSDMSFEEESNAADDSPLGENGDGDDDLSALLAGMDHDEDLSEIHDLLGEAEQGVSTDDDILAMLEGAGDGDTDFDLFENDEAAREAESIRELTPEEIAAREGGDGKKKKKEKKKRKKLFGKKKDDEKQPVEELSTELEDLLGEVSDQEAGQKIDKEKKPGLVARIMDFLLESDEEDEDPLTAEVRAGSGGATGYISGENQELLDELNEEDKKGKKKKKKEKEKKKAKKEKKEEAKEKKPQKEKKKKKKKEKASPEVDLLAPPEKRLSKKKVIIVFLFCGTIAACIILATSILPNYMQEQEARIAYDQREYREVYDLLYGKDLKEEDEILFQRSKLILTMGRKLSSYENYVNLDMRLEALDALISGVERYQTVLPEAEAYNVGNEVTDIYVQILGKLSADFGVSEADVLDIIGSEDDEVYSQRLMDIINGTYASEAEADMSGIRQDVLPEEEEIIDRIDGLPEEEPTADENSDEGSEM